MKTQQQQSDCNQIGHFSVFKRGEHTEETAGNQNTEGQRPQMGITRMPEQQWGKIADHKRQHISGPLRKSGQLRNCRYI
ncbi:hypothetical protein D3C71_2142350 [compost metagenome]